MTSGKVPQDAVDLAHLAGRVVQRRSYRRLDIDLELAVVLGRHEFDADQRHDGETADKGCDRDAQRGDPVAQAPAQHRAVAECEPIEESAEDCDQFTQRAAFCIRFRGRVVPDRGHHRIEREGDEERDQHRDRDRHAELQEEPPDDTIHEGHRQEHGDDRERRGQYGQPDLVRALQVPLAGAICPYAGAA